MEKKYIKIKNASENNLKNININIPKNSFVVITGVSGSGKSSLAFDTIYAEAHRRFVESLSSYARQFIKVLKKPKLDFIEGLSPSISINQKTNISSQRSTVGTITEIYDYLRLLFSKIATATCYECSNAMEGKKASILIDELIALEEGTLLTILAPIVRSRKGSYNTLLETFKEQGYFKFYIDKKMYSLDEENINLDKNKIHNIDILIDKIIIKNNIKLRLKEAVSTAYKLGKGLIKIQINHQEEEKLYSEKQACINCNISYIDAEPRLFSFNSPLGACPTCNGIGFDFEETKTCKTCNGKRLKPESLAYKIDDFNIYELSNMQVDKLKIFIINIKNNSIVFSKISKEIISRLNFLENIGLSYLTLNRLSSSLSGGEYQRVRLSSQLGASLTGIIYVLDEPSIGLHPLDNEKLINSLIQLKNNGNSVIVIEHDEATIKAADYIIDLGPGAGVHGGNICQEGEKLLNTSLTGLYINKLKKIKVLSSKKTSTDGFIKINAANNNNLKNIDVKIPLGLITCVTGVSGSGKSSLVIDNLLPNILKLREDKNTILSNCKNIEAYEVFKSIYSIDQTPIGRSPRSNPATYIGFFNYIRDLLSKTPDAKFKAYSSSYFSFNVDGGRCEHCQGQGYIKLEMKFLNDEYIKCTKCRGERFKKEILNIKYKNKNISQILDLTVLEALDFFKNIRSIFNKLKILDEVGLSYIKLGQAATSFSGGEAQRIKIAKELCKQTKGKTLYILDEPTTGLHFDDIQKLINILVKLRDKNNTIIIIEHNTELIKASDYIIELGPLAGEEGGYLIAQGFINDIINNKESLTARFLKD